MASVEHGSTAGGTERPKYVIYHGKMDAAIMLRIHPNTRKLLHELATFSGKSLNDYICSKLGIKREFPKKSNNYIKSDTILLPPGFDFSENSSGI